VESNLREASSTRRQRYTGRNPLQVAQHGVYVDVAGVVWYDMVPVGNTDPDAAVVIMTTEILRNLLFKKDSSTRELGPMADLSIDGLDAVVFDECHYINDRDRGKIWEETMILLPPPVQLILLSATLDSPQYFAQWLSELKGKPCALIETQYRVVPLIHSVLVGRESQTLMDAKEIFNPKTYNDWLQWRKSRAKEPSTCLPARSYTLSKRAATSDST
jgi:superfamily II RNA helicase